MIEFSALAEWLMPRLFWFVFVPFVSILFAVAFILGRMSA